MTKICCSPTKFGQEPERKRRNGRKLTIAWERRFSRRMEWFYLLTVGLYRERASLSLVDFRGFGTSEYIWARTKAARDSLEAEQTCALRVGQKLTNVTRKQNFSEPDPMLRFVDSSLASYALSGRIWFRFWRLVNSLFFKRFFDFFWKSCVSQ